jgi:hypothetical protein
MTNDELSSIRRYVEAMNSIDKSTGYTVTLLNEVERQNAEIAMLKRALEWIPVSERLPEKTGTYLVAYHPCYWDNVEPEIRVGIDSFRGKTVWAKKKYQRVTHWMLLPEPPKEAADNAK